MLHAPTKAPLEPLDEGLDRERVPLVDSDDALDVVGPAAQALRQRQIVFVRHRNCQPLEAGNARLAHTIAVAVGDFRNSRQLDADQEPGLQLGGFTSAREGLDVADGHLEQVDVGCTDVRAVAKDRSGAADHDRGQWLRQISVDGS